MDWIIDSRIAIDNIPIRLLIIYLKYSLVVSIFGFHDIVLLLHLWYN